MCFEEYKWTFTLARFLLLHISAHDCQLNCKAELEHSPHSPVDSQVNLLTSALYYLSKLNMEHLTL